MDVEKLFTVYGQALVDGDIETTVAHYGFPCSVLTDDFVGSLSDPDQLRAALRGASGYYARFGLVGVRLEILGVDRVSEKITRVRLRWDFLGADGALIVDTHYEYTLRADADGPHIYLVVSIDEAQKLAALAGS
jgi:hypothetical protein